jgi:hypothetical protein
MTGMLNAVPKTPLYDRLRKAGRLMAESVGDQFVFTNIVPLGMTRVQLYEGYKQLLQRLYSYRNYRRRTMQLILSKGTQIKGRLIAGSQDFGIFRRVMRDCILKASPRRAWMTLSLMLETALRRPDAIRDAVSFALIHKHLYEYMVDTCARIDQLIHELQELPEHIEMLPVNTMTETPQRGPA